MDVVATPVGNLPVRSDLTLDDVEVSETALELLTSIHADAWIFEVDAIASYFTSLGDTVPLKLGDRLDVIKSALR